MADRSEAAQVALITSRSQLAIAIIAGLFGLAGTWLAGWAAGEKREARNDSAEGNVIDSAERNVAMLRATLQQRERTIVDLQRQLTQMQATCLPMPSRSTGDVVSEEGFVITLKSCQLSRDELVCEFSAVAEKEDSDLRLYSWSRLIESDGNELLASRIRLGRDEQIGQSQAVNANLVRSVPVAMSVRFAGLRTHGSAATVPLIELIFSGFKAQFRDVPIR